MTNQNSCIQDPWERLTSRVVATDGGCWEWTGARNVYGYGRFSINGQTRQAHRVAYELRVGPIPTGLQIDHLCRNRGCVNPDHLEPVTPKENVIRGVMARQHGGGPA